MVAPKIEDGRALEEFERGRLYDFLNYSDLKIEQLVPELSDLIVSGVNSEDLLETVLSLLKDQAKVGQVEFAVRQAKNKVVVDEVMVGRERDNARSLLDLKRELFFDSK